MLLALLINHPQLYDELGEQLGTWPLADPRLRELRQRVAALLDADSALDSAGLARQLIEAGFGAELARIATKRLYDRVVFVAPGISLEQARAGWHDLERRLAIQRIRRDVQAAGATLAEDWSDANVARLRALYREVEAGIDADSVASDGLPGAPVPGALVNVKARAT